jgi:hypothetical protein
MKKLICFAIIGFLSIHSLKANPIAEPTIITEFAFDNGSFTIELFFQDMFQGWITNLDELNLCCSAGSVEFNDGIQVVFNQPMVLDETDVIGILFLNPEQDMVWIEEGPGWIIGGDQIGWGDIAYYWPLMVPPSPNQSIATLGFLDPNSGLIMQWTRAMEEPPTFGYNAFSINARGSLEGYVFDLDNNPVQWALINNQVTTDETGYFKLPDTLCHIYECFSVRYNGATVLEFCDTIHPNQTSYKEFHLPITLVGVPEYTNHPNPFGVSTEITVVIPEGLDYSKGLLEIFDISGQRIGSTPLSGQTNVIPWNASGLPPGIYFYRILLDNRPYDTKKMIKH